MYRDRTNLYISYRQSYAHHPQYATSGGSGFDRIPEEQQGLIAASYSDQNPFQDELAIEMDLLPPPWVDVSDEVDETLDSAREKIDRLSTLHRKNALPGFDDRSHDEELIEQITLDITADLHTCQRLIKTFEQMSSSSTAPAEIKMSANMKISLATKVQDVSTSFRKMQANYLKSLRNESFPTPASSTDRAASPALYDGAIGDDLDIKLSESALRQSSVLMETDDVTLRQREQEISKIAQGILELADIFKDLQTMVIDQGTLLDRIDYNIETTYTNVKGADKELIQATHYQKRTQKCKIILLLTLIVVGLLILVIIKPKRHGGGGSSNPPPKAPEQIPSDPDVEVPGDAGV